jgi:hypothetical protein
MLQIKITEKTLYEIKTILLTHSALVAVANIFNFTHEINTVLYFSIVMSFFIFTAIIFINPTTLYKTTKNIFFGYLNADEINALGILLHALPVYLFKDRQSFRELLKPRIIFYSAAVSLLYYIIFRNMLNQLYGVKESTIFILCISYYLLFIVLSLITKKYNI